MQFLRTCGVKSKISGESTLEVGKEVVIREEGRRCIYWREYLGAGGWWWGIQPWGWVEGSEAEGRLCRVQAGGWTGSKRSRSCSQCRILDWAEKVQSSAKDEVINWWAIVENAMRVVREGLEFPYVWCERILRILRARRCLASLPTSVKPFLIISDSRVSLKASYLSPSHPLVTRIQSLLETCSSTSIIIIFIWAPGHLGITGNEKVDKARTQAIHPTTVFKSSFTSINFHPTLLYHWIHSLTLVLSMERPITTTRK